MYAIGNIVYGCPFTKEIQEVCDKLDVDPEDFFEMGYHGSLDYCGWFGINLGTFDECSNFLLGNLNLEPTEFQRFEVADLFRNIPEEIQRVMLPTNIWVIWSSS